MCITRQITWNTFEDNNIIVILHNEIIIRTIMYEFLEDVLEDPL